MGSCPQFQVVGLGVRGFTANGENITDLWIIHHGDNANSQLRLSGTNCPFASPPTPVLERSHL